MDRNCQSCGRPLPPDFDRPVCVACAFNNALSDNQGSKAAIGAPDEATKRIDPPLAAEGGRAESSGESFGDYDLLEEIGRGGMGVVYRARQRSLNRIVAVKRFLPGIRPSPATIRRFHTEAESAAALRHSGIVGIHEIGEHDGQPFFSMEFVEGTPMNQLMRDGPLRVRQAAEYVRKIAEAVDCAHEQGIVHRDLKPSNVLIDRRGDPRVTDFGLAKRLWGRSDLTLSGQVLGTPSFMAPEQVSSKEGKVGPRSDIYSLGAILYYAATGRPPHQAASTEATLREVLLSEPVAPKSLNPSLPLDLQTICLKCLEKEPSRRYATARELADDVGRFLRDEPIHARPVSPPEQLWRWCRRKPAVASLAASVLLLLTAIAVVSTFSAHRISKTLQAERQENYFNEIARAYNFIQDDQYNRARDILNREDSAPYRGWEWGHLQWLCNQDSLTLEGAGDAPQVVAFSPDERVLALGAYDGKLKVWNVVTGRLRFEVNAHAGVVTGLAFSSDGQRILTCSGWGPDVKMVKIWDAMTGAPMPGFAITKPLKYSWRLACSPDGEWVAVGGYKRVELRNAHTYDLVRTLSGHSDRVTALAFSPDGRVLASGSGNGFPYQASKDGSIVLWDVGTGQMLHRLAGSSDTVRGLAFSQDGRRMASIGMSRDNRRWGRAGVGGTMKLWDVGAGTLIHDFDSPIPVGQPWRFDVGFGVVFCRQDRYLLSAHVDSQIRLWDTNGTEIRSLKGHTTAVHAIALSQTGEKLASASFDGTAKIWSLDNVFAPRDLIGHNLPVWALAFSPDSTHLASGSWDGTVKLWNPKTRRLERSIPVGFPVISLAFSPDGRHLATVGPKYSVLVWDVVQGRRSFELKGHSSTVLCVAYSPSGTRIATGGKDCAVRLWDSQTGRLQATLAGQAGHKGWVFDVDFSADGKRLASASRDGTVKLWEVEPGRLLQTLTGHSSGVLCAKFSPDGRWIASGSDDQTVRIWDAIWGTFHRQLTGHKLHGEVRSLAWSPDGRRLATASSSLALYRPLITADFAVRLWDVDTGNELLALAGNTDCIYALAFSADGRFLASANADSVVKLFPAFPWKKPGGMLGDSSSEKWIEQWKRTFREEQDTAFQAEEVSLDSRTEDARESSQRSEPLAIPARSPRAAPGMMDLTGFYNASLDRDWVPYWGLDQLDLNLSSLPKGIQRFSDVGFDVRGIVQLRSLEPGWEAYPKQVTGIPVGRRVSRLHVLHGTAFSEEPEEVVAAYILRYADGTKKELPVRYEREVWKWTYTAGDEPPEGLKLAWRAPDPTRPVAKGVLCLFQSDWDNPEPDKVVQQIDFVSKMTRSAPFLIAMTVE